MLLYLAPKPPRATDAMDVELTVIREIIIDDKRDLEKWKQMHSVKKKSISCNHALEATSK